MVCLAIVAILTGVTVAVATASGYGRGSGHSSSHHHAKHKGLKARPGGHRSGAGELASAASYLGLTRVQLRSELKSGKTLAQVAESTSGKSVSGLIDAILSARVAGSNAQAKGALPQSRLASVRDHITAKVEGAGELASAASYLGVSRSQLHSDLRSGETLAQVAGATPGRSSAGLIDALVKAKTSELAASLASGAISPEREKRLLAALPRRTRRRVGRTAAKHHSGAHPQAPTSGA
jgi:hypothetical protein